MKTTTAWALPTIDLRRCTGCGLCQRLCPTHAVEVRGARAVIVRPEACTFCELCESYCPEGAIGRPFTVGFAPSAPERASR
jgi:ferredoxin